MRKLYYSVLFLMVSSFAYAGDLEDALSSYAKRGDSIVDIKSGSVKAGVFKSSSANKSSLVSNGIKAFELFDKIVLKSGSSDSELAVALDGLGRSSYFLGVLTGDLLSLSKKEKYFSRCRLSAAKHTGNESVATVAQSVRLICTAYWFKVMNQMSRIKALFKVPKLKKIFNEFIANDLQLRDDRLKIDLAYLGGGVERTVAGIFSNKTAANFNSTLKDRKVAFAHAIELAENALARESFSDPLLPGLAKHSGLDYYGNHRVHAELYVLLMKESAKVKSNVLTHFGDQDDYSSVKEKAEELFEEYLEEITDRLKSKSDPIPEDMKVDAILEKRLIRQLKESI